MYNDYSVKWDIPGNRWVVNVFLDGKWTDLVYFDTTEEMCRYLDKRIQE